MLIQASEIPIGFDLVLKSQLKMVGLPYKIHNELSLITQKNTMPTILLILIHHADGYNLKLEHNEFDCKIQ